MTRPLSDFPVIDLDGFHAVLVPDWNRHIGHSSRMSRPLRPECPDMWILTSDRADAGELAKLVQRNLQPEHVEGLRDKVVTVNRQPTFAAVIPVIPQDVAYCFSTSQRIDDQALIERLHPAPAGVNERITWSSGKYRVRSLHGRFETEISAAPRAFARSLARAREELVAAVGTGFDQTQEGLTASPVLAGLLPLLTRPAAEAVSYWMKGLGTSELETLVIPRVGLVTDLPISSLHFESKGVNRRACFFANMADARITISDYEVSGISLPDTLCVGLDDLARKGELRLSQIVDLPGADLVPVVSVDHVGSRWTARLQPVSVAVEPPSSDLPFDAPDELRRIAEDGNEMGSEAAFILRQIGKERADFILCCVEDGSSGRHFDISAWTPDDLPMRMLLRERMYRPESLRALPLLASQGTAA